MLSTTTRRSPVSPRGNISASASDDPCALSSPGQPWVKFHGEARRERRMGFGVELWPSQALKFEAAWHPPWPWLCPLAVLGEGQRLYRSGTGCSATAGHSLKQAGVLPHQPTLSQAPIPQAIQGAEPKCLLTLSFFEMGLTRICIVPVVLETSESAPCLLTPRSSAPAALSHRISATVAVLGRLPEDPGRVRAPPPHTFRY